MKKIITLLLALVLSLLVYLAQRNHIAIHPGKRKRDFVLTKCHGYVGQDTNLAVFMDGLVPDGRTFTINAPVSKACPSAPLPWRAPCPRHAPRPPWLPADAPP